jgi:hypothetical protein
MVEGRVNEYDISIVSHVRFVLFFIRSIAQERSLLCLNIVSFRGDTIK